MLRPAVDTVVGLPGESPADPIEKVSPPAQCYPHRMAWLILIVAALLEVGWAIGLKYAAGFTRFWPSLWTLIALVLSVALLAAAARTLPIGTAYAVWTGIGAAGTALLGIWLFQEPATAARLACIAMILAGVVGLKLVSAG